MVQILGCGLLAEMVRQSKSCPTAQLLLFFRAKHMIRELRSLEPFISHTHFTCKKWWEEKVKQKKIPVYPLICVCQQR